MKCMSAAAIKGLKSRPENDFPQEGTAVRQVYDRFQSNKGIPIEFDYVDGPLNTIFNRLTDTYGLDIRRVRRAHKWSKSKSMFVLAGEWFGKVYVDYIAERLEADARKK